MPNEKLCFVIAPIGDEDSEVRKRSDQIFKHVIEPIAKVRGYRAMRADHLTKLGSITTDIVEHILVDALVIADLTGHNPNVMYELAIRHAVRKPVVQMIQKGEKLPFDIAQQRTIPIDYKDLDSVEAAKDHLLKQIQSVELDPTQVDSPVSVALDTSMLKTSAKPFESLLVEMLSLLQEVKNDQKLLIARAEPIGANALYSGAYKRLLNEEISSLPLAGNVLAEMFRNNEQMIKKAAYKTLFPLIKEKKNEEQDGME
jgi:hypothetical protein